MIFNKTTISKSTVITRGILFSLIWWALTDGNTQSWWIGVPAVLLAAISSVVLVQPVTFIWYEFFKFVPLFLIHSLLGGADVARRAFHPKMPIAPDHIEYRLQLPAGLARVFMLNTVNLLPGTLSTKLDGNMLKVHVLDKHKDFHSELVTVEKSVARMFAIPLNDSARGV